MERPIIFSGEMVRAILEGRKTQTRRIVKFHGQNTLFFQSQAHHDFKTAIPCKKGGWVFWDSEYTKALQAFHDEVYSELRDGMKCPYGQPGSVLSSRPKSAGWYDVRWEPGDEWTRIWLFDGGECWGYSPNDDPESVFLDIADSEKTLWKTPGDQLWVRETWKPGAWLADDGLIAIDYKASPEITSTPWVQIPDDYDGEKFNSLWISLCNELHSKGIEPYDDEQYHWEHGKSPLKWRSSIFMPRWASRITLEIISVKIERLQDVSEEDAVAEGMFEPYGCRSESGLNYEMRSQFKNCWDSINRKKYPWESNPWVWVIEFKRIN